MPAAIKDVIDLIEHTAPKELAYDWDNTGLLIKCSDHVENILITLDVTPEVVKEAVDSGCDMILSHHPLIFSAIKSLSIDDYTNSLVMELIRNKISLYSAHTSFDRAEGGINDALAKIFGLACVETVGGEGEDLMRIGQLRNKISGSELAEHVKAKLRCKYVKVTNEEKAVKRVAVIGGSGGEFAKVAKNQGADALITGEAKHNHHLEARGLDILLIEAGHYQTEQIFADIIFSGLQSRLNEVQLDLGLKKAESSCVPYSIV